ncbi:SEL1-like repeat protein [Phocaeicola vulgatus]|nr:SEL1-like repeat protein [Phocaeicola vulgatus]
MRCLGDCYANGIGVRKNAKQAAAWYAKAAEHEA